MLSDEFEIQFAESPLLTHVRTITTTDARPTIGWRSENFRSWFDGVEGGDLAPNLILHKLERPSPDDPIIDLLGGEEVAKITKSDFYAALAEKEAKGDHMPLIGYAEDVNDILRAVIAFWYAGGGGWGVDAYPVGHPVGWDDGRQVVSRPSTKA
jgi:hypothetical protein